MLIICFSIKSYDFRGTAAAHWCNTTNWSELFRGDSVARGHLIQAFTRVWQFSEVGLLRKLVCERFVFILCASTKRYWTSYELGNFSCKHFASLLYSRHLLCLRRELLGFHEKPPGSWLVFRYGGMWPRHIEILYYIFVPRNYITNHKLLDSVNGRFHESIVESII